MGARDTSIMYGMAGVLLAIGIVVFRADQADAQIARRAAGGALKGAAIGNLSGGDSGKGAAWGAGAGAVRGVAEKKRDAAQAEERQSELDQAYEMGYSDAMNGLAPAEVDGPSAQGGQAQIAKGAARGALGGAAIGKLSDGDAGTGAAWGAGGGAIKGAVQKERDAETASAQYEALNNAYQQGYRRGMGEKRAVRTQ